MRANNTFSLEIRTYAMLALCISQPLCVGEPLQLDRALIPADERACVFAGAEASFIYGSTEQPGETVKYLDWHVDWKLVRENRTLQRGSSRAVPPGLADVPSYLVTIPMPTLRDSVVLAVKLEMQWRADGSEYRHSRPLYLFSPNPFSTRQAFLQNARIKLFDPMGSTAERFEAHEIPHTRLLNLSAIDLVTEGIVVVGEGVSLREQRTLPQSLLKAAARGVSVLCLAHSEGDFPLRAEQRGELLSPSRLVLERGGVLRRYDKRFDELPTLSHFSLEALRNEVVLGSTEHQVEDRVDWSWLQMQFPPRQPERAGGQLVATKLKLVSQWDVSPVPRYLFLKLLEQLTHKPSLPENTKDVPTQ